jgi:hypothetical protein
MMTVDKLNKILKLISEKMPKRFIVYSHLSFIT